MRVKSITVKVRVSLKERVTRDPVRGKVEDNDEVKVRVSKSECQGKGES